MSCYVMLRSRVLYFHRVLKSMLSNLPVAAGICCFWREYFITLQSFSVRAFCNIEKILEVSLLKRQWGEAFSLVTIKFRSKTLQKIASRWPHQIAWAHGIGKLTSILNNHCNCNTMWSGRLAVLMKSYLISFL